MSEFTLTFNSSAIRKIEMNENNTLKIQFNNRDTIYNYYNISNQVKTGLLNCLLHKHSVGEFYNKFIKGAFQHPITVICKRFSQKVPEGLKYLLDCELQVIKDLQLSETEHLLQFRYYIADGDIDNQSLIMIYFFFSDDTLNFRYVSI